MYQSTRGSKIKPNGYTLLEALFQLVMLVIFSQSIVFIFLWISQLNNSFFTQENISWEMFISDIQQYLNNIEEVSTLDRNKGVTIKQAHITETITISQSSDVIRLQKDNRGNIPLLVGIKNSTFSLNENYLKIYVELQSGAIKERTLFVQYAQK